MIELERTRDMDLVKAIITSPEVYEQSSDDFAPSPEEYTPPEDQAVYVLVKKHGTPVGLWILVPQSRIRYQIHTCLTRRLRGFRALDAAARMSEWIWQNTPCESLVTEVPECNQPALWFAKAAGMKEWGREPQCFLKGSVFYDSIWLGMNRPKGVEDCR